jgi:tricorn protease
MRPNCLAVFVLSIALGTGAAGAPALMPRHPAPSPDGSSIAFSWQGDLWVVSSDGGRATRLTAHPADDRYPVWSRDGSLLAFASDRYGNLDVFVMPADASAEPRRLTHASVHDVPLDFTHGRQGVVFMSSRDETIRDQSGFYITPVTGGTPSLAQSALGRWGAYSPDGGRFAFVRGGTPWWRRGYHGSANRDLWLRDAAGRYTRLTDFDGDDDRPSWIDNQTLAYLSERQGIKNLFLLDLVTGATRPLSAHADFDVRFPRASADGSLLAYEHGDAIWVLPLPTGPARRLQIEVPADNVRNLLEHKVDRKGAQELAVHPKGELAAIVVHGDLFVVPIMSKDDQEIAPPRTVRVTTTTAREEHVSWSPDGESLLFTSDAGGDRDVYLLRPADGDRRWLDSYDFAWQRLTNSPEEDYSAQFSPDGRQIAFLRSRGDLMLMDATGGREHRLVAAWRPPDYRWSPDGKWIAYSVVDAEYNDDVWVIPVAGGDPYNVSRHPDTDARPRWSPDGRRLVWLSKRHADTQDIWGVWLTRRDDERTPEDWLAVWKKDDTSSPGGGKSGGDSDQADDAVPAVVIDFDGLWERVKSITELGGNEAEVQQTPDGKRFVFTAEHEGERDLYSIRWDGKDLKRLTTGGQQPTMVQLDPKGEMAFYLDKGGVAKRVGLDAKAGDPVPFEARYEVDAMAEKAQVFDEAWRTMDLWFYDPNFHGTDWAAQRDRYRPLALSASHEDDFADAIRLMLGELNSSHVWYSPKRPDALETTGWIGALFDPGRGGPGIAIREVLPHSPAAATDVDLRIGDRILAVDGASVETDTNIYSLFTNTVDRPVHLEVLTTDGTRRITTVRPIGRSQELGLRYREWVRERRALVERLSDGRLGYLHIKGMNVPSFEDFERDLYAAAHGKEALVIDVRSNSGGWTTDYLMAALNVRRHAYTLARGLDRSTRAYPQVRLPLAAWTRPAIALCDEESFSNAEIFSHAFKTLERGLLVGNPTFGGVISTGSITLLNGGRLAMPSRGWFVAGTDEPMENNGAVPDIVVPRPPEEDLSPERDSQLEKTVEVLLETMRQDPRYGAW